MIEITSPTLVVMFSGGLDSLGALYKALTDSTYSQYAIHVHHIHLKNYEDRDAAEDIAVAAILEAIKKIPTLKEPTISYSTFTFPDINKGVLIDAIVVNFIAGNLIQRFPFIQKVALGVTKDDDINTRDITAANQAVALFALFSDTAAKVYPVRTMSKQEIYDMLPVDLRKLAWYCRTPNKVNDKYIPCGGCHSCIAMIEITRVK